MNSKKYILFLSHYFYPEGNAPAARVYEMARQWVREGHQVTVITSNPNVPNGVVYPGYRNGWKQKECIDGIDVIRVWTHIAPNRGVIRRILNYLSFMLTAVLAAMSVRRPDLIITTSPQFFCGFAGVILKKLFRIPFILEIRDLWPESISVLGAIRNQFIIGPLEWLEKTMYKTADHIVIVSRAFQDHIIARGGKPDCISTITNGVDLDEFYPRANDHLLRKQYHLNGEFVCAYIGTIGMASGLEVALEAARILRQRDLRHIKLMLVGDGAIRDDLQRQARNENLDNIIFTGRQDKNQIPEYLASSDVCLVHLKRNDLFKLVIPSKIFEAAAMARPIVLGVEGYAARLLELSGAGCCIEPENAEQLVNTLTYLADNPAERTQMGIAGRQYVTKYFNRATLAMDFLQLIQTLLESRSMKPGTTPGCSDQPAPIQLSIPVFRVREPVFRDMIEKTPGRTVQNV